MEREALSNGTPATANPRRSSHRRIVLVLAILYLAVQAIAPLYPTVLRIRDGDRSRQYGWQMFTVKANAMRWKVSLGDGTVREFSLDDLAYYRREDVSYEPHVTQYLCKHVPGAVSVRRFVGVRDGAPATKLDATTSCGAGRT